MTIQIHWKSLTLWDTVDAALNALNAMTPERFADHREKTELLDATASGGLD